MISTDASSTKAALTNEPMAKVTSPDGRKQTTNRLDTDWSEQQSRQIASIIRQLTTGWKERSRAAQMLVALCDLVEQEPSRLDPGNDPQVWGFQAMEIGEALQERFNDAGKWATDPVSAKERMSEHWPKLEEIWERQEATILDGLQDAAIEPRPSLHRLAEKGGSGKRNRYGFRFDTQADGVTRQDSASVDIRDVRPVRYRRLDISGNRLVRWMSDRGLYLGGWGGKVFLSVFALLLIFTVFWAWLVIVAMGASPSAVTFLKLGSDNHRNENLR